MRTDEDAAIRERLLAAVDDWQLATGGNLNDLAKRAGISHGTMRKWAAPGLGGLPRLRDLARLVEALGVSERYILTGDDDMGRRMLSAERAIAGVEKRLEGLGVTLAGYLAGDTVDPDAVREQTRASS